MSVQQFDDIPIKVDCTFSRKNLVTCIQSHVAQNRTIELDKLLIGNQSIAQKYTDTKTVKLWAFVIIQCVLNLFLLWRVMR